MYFLWFQPLYLRLDGGNFEFGGTAVCLFRQEWLSGGDMIPLDDYETSGE